MTADAEHDALLEARDFVADEAESRSRNIWPDGAAEAKRVLAVINAAPERWRGRVTEPQAIPTPSTGPDADAAMFPCPRCKQDDTGVLDDDDVCWTAWCDQVGCGFQVTEATREEAVVAWNRSSFIQSTPPAPLSATPPVDVEALIAKAKAATPGPWEIEFGSVYGVGCEYGVISETGFVHAGIVADVKRLKRELSD